jgi:hypothetical protein
MMMIYLSCILGGRRGAAYNPRRILDDSQVDCTVTTNIFKIFFCRYKVDEQEFGREIDDLRVPFLRRMTHRDYTSAFGVYEASTQLTIYPTVAALGGA